MAEIIDLDGERLSRTPEFRAQFDATEACRALLRHFEHGCAVLSPDEAAEALEAIRRAISPVERTA